MDKTDTINTLRNFHQLLPRIERVVEALDLGWCGDDSIDFSETDFDNPEGAIFILNWEEHHYGDTEDMSEYVPLHLLWSDEIKTLEAEKKRQEEARREEQRQRDIANAKRRVAEAERDLKTAEGRALATLKVAQERLQNLLDPS